MSKRRILPKKPTPLVEVVSLHQRKWEYCKVFEEAAPHQFQDTEDPMMIYGVELEGTVIWDTMNYKVKDLAKKCRSMAKWLNKFADWIETIRQEGDRCHRRR